MVALAAGGGQSAEAQIQLPGITVTAPSPVRKARPPTPPAPVAAPPAGAPVQAVDPGEEDVFVPLTIVGEREIVAVPGANLADALQYRPGIAGSTFAPGSNRPVIRGLDNYRVRIQENGIGSHDVSALSEDHGVPIDPFAADRIEVVRGPATLRYGSQAIGGVVSVSNERIPEALPPRGWNAETRGGLGSVDGGADGAFKVTAGAGKFAVHADAFRRSADDYDTPRGVQPNSFVENEGFSVGSSYIGRDGFAGIAFMRYDALYGIPGAEALDERPRIDMRQDKVLSRGEWRVRDFGLEAIRYWFGASDYEHREIALGSGAPEAGSLFLNRESEGRIELQHSPAMTAFGELNGAVGVQFGRRRASATSFEGDSLLAPARTSSVAAFWFEELQVTKLLSLQAAVRVEHTAVAGTGLDPSGPLSGAVLSEDRDFMPVSASAGLLYRLPLGVVARLTAQYVERAPADAELFSKGVHEATATFEIGNPFLDIERARTVEIGFRRTQGVFRFDASVYHTRFGGFIFKQRTGETCEETLASCTPAGGGGDLDQVLFAQRDAVFTGAELLAQYDAGRLGRGIWGVDGQYDFVRAEFDDTAGGNVPRIPPHRIGAGVYYRDTNWFARLGFLHAFAQNRIGDNETPTKGYTLLDADLSYTFRQEPAFGAPFEMTIGVRGQNLLDDDVRNHVSFQKDEVLQPGRNVRLYGIVKLN